MARKGQAINIDWSVGLSLFLVTILSGLLILTGLDFGPGDLTGLRNQAGNVQESLREESSLTGRQVPLIVKTPVELDSIPVDTSYIFPDSAGSDSAAMTIPSEVIMVEDRVVTVLDAKNTSYPLTFFFDDVSDLTYQNDIQITSNRIENSVISVNPGNNGLTSLQVNGKELLYSEAVLGSSDDSMTENELHAETLGGDLKVYSGTGEMIFEADRKTTWYLENQSTLYWYADDSTQSLAGTGDIKSGSTKGFTVASDHGITFVGDMNVNISKPNASTVKAEIDTERLRIRVHDSDYQEGKKRAQIFDQGRIEFGASKEISGPYREKLNELASLSRTEFEDRTGLTGWGYNITFIEFQRNMTDTLEEWNQGTMNGVSASRNDNSGNLALGYRNGTPTDSLVGYWRMDNIVSGDGGTVKDYSGNGNDGTTHGGVSTGQEGVFRTNSFRFDGTDDYIEVQEPVNLTTRSFTVSAWLKPNKNPSAQQTYFLARSDSSDNKAIHLRFYDNGRIRFGFYGDDLNTDTGVAQFGKWQHVAMTYDNSTDTSRIYFNGEKVAQGSNGPFTGSNPDTRIGAWPGTEHWNGSIDELRVYSRALSNSEVNQNINQKAPIAHWDFDQGTGETVDDQSLNHNDGIFSSPGPASEKRYIVNEYHANRDLAVVSYEDSNNIYAGTCSEAVDRGEVYYFSSGCYSVTDTVYADEAFSAHFTQGGSDGPVPESFMGTEFVYHECRDSDYFNIVAPKGAASVSITNSSGTVATANIASGGHQEINVDMPRSVYTIESDNPVLVTYDRNMGDVFMLHPATHDLWGYVEDIVVSKDNTQVTIYDSDGNIQTDGVFNKYDNLGGVGNYQGGSETLHAVANQSALGAERCADADNGESDIGISGNRLANEFYIPEPMEGLGNNDGDYYMTFTLSDAGTCSVYYSNGTKAGEKSTTNSPPYPGFITFNSEEDFNLSAGSRVSCTAPAALQWEPSDYEGESNLYGRKIWTDGKFGNGLEMNGDDEIDIDTRQLSTENFTAMGWVNYNDLSKSSGNFASGLITSIDSGFEWGIYGGNGDIKGYVRPDSTSEILSYNANENQWYHVAIVKENDNFKMYVDGDIVAESTDPVIDGEISMNNFAIGRGTRDHLQHQWLDGKIDDIRVYDYAVSKQRIDQIRQENLNEKSLQGTYSTNFLGENPRSWESVTVESVIEGTSSGEISFDTLDEDGDVEKEKDLNMIEGQTEHLLGLSSYGYNMSLILGSDDPTETPILNFHNLKYGNGVLRGSNIPFSQSVIVNNRPTAILNRTGQFETMDSRVAIWQ